MICINVLITASVLNIKQIMNNFFPLTGIYSRKTKSLWQIIFTIFPDLVRLFITVLLICLFFGKAYKNFIQCRQAFFHNYLAVADFPNDISWDTSMCPGVWLIEKSVVWITRFQKCQDNFVLLSSCKTINELQMLNLRQWKFAWNTNLLK